MPPRRRPGSSPAISLPVNRLPIGTPHHREDRIFNPAHSSDTPKVQRLPGVQHRGTPAPEGSSVGIEKKQPQPSLIDSENRADLPPQEKPLAPLATAKLVFQNKRIEEADAALMSHVQNEKVRGQPRSKARVWKHLDLADDIYTSQADLFGNRSAINDSQVKVNTAASSVTSQLGQGEPSYLDAHQDNDHGDYNDFQVIIGRKSRRVGSASHFHEPMTESQHFKLETSFSKREISDVFGNELPSTTFIDSNPGMQSGQIQFVQHPNGDVSAHQWSGSRYEWENIGQFSNVRKRIEGQLSSDRLKGETAKQALKQNTLAYFRLVAKQREAVTMNLSFGSKEINACIPDLNPLSQSPCVPSSSKKPLNAAFATVTETNPQLQGSRTLPDPTIIRDIATRTNENSSTGTLRLLPVSRLSYAPSDQSQYLATQLYRQDPQYSHHSQPVGNFSDPRLFASQYLYPTTHAQYNQGQVPAFPQSSSAYGWSHPPSGSNLSPLYRGQAWSSEGASLTPYSGELLRSYVSASAIDGQNAYNAAYTNPSGLPGYSDLFTSQWQVEDDLSKATTPLEARSMMRDAVMKMPEQAKERNKSQSNIRTVLHDPFQQLPSTAERLQEEISDHTLTPTRSESTIGLNTHLQKNGSGQPSDDFHTHARLTHDSSTLTESSLRDSSPDRDWQRKPAEKFEIANTSLSSQPTPQNFNGPFFTNDLQFKMFNPQIKKESIKSHDEELDDWWWSGNRFARQEEFYQSIKATDRVSPARLHMSTAPSSRAAASGEGTPSTRSVDNEDSLSRMLVPVLENLSAYIQGPPDKRRGYFCQWTKAPEWCVDRSPEGRNSFFDSDWGQPPARVGRDPRYRPMVEDGRFARSHSSAPGAAGVDRRFAFASKW